MDDVERQPGAVREEDLEIAHPAFGRHRHLVDRRDAEGDGDARGLQLQLLDVVFGQVGGEPALGDLSGIRGEPAGGRAGVVGLDPGLARRVDRLQGR